MILVTLRKLRGKSASSRYHSPPVRRRVVVMRPNVLYAAQAGCSSDKDVVGESDVPLLPQVKIEGNGIKYRSGVIVPINEYEIPVDADWEYPRNK